RHSRSMHQVTTRHFIIATGGHVDHGKSVLVKALTGTDPDRLPEEKARGITIDLGFAELNLTGRDGEQFHVGIVDVPGHENSVRSWNELHSQIAKSFRLRSVLARESQI